MSGYYAKVSNISGGKSCVATSAYMSREKMKDKQMNHTFNYAGHEKDNTFSNVTLCKGAPEEWQDKEKLWNAVEEAEKGKNTRKAKQWILAVPQELTQEQAEKAVKDFQEYLAGKGMCSQADIHEPDSKRSASQIEKNKHVHVLATQRLLNEQGEWEQIKEKKVYANCRNAEGKPAYNPDIPNDTAHRIPQLNPDGTQKVRVRKGKGEEKLWERVTIQDNPLNKKEFVEESRAKWAEVCNKHLAAEQQIDHRSYDRQGIDRVAQIHEGIGYHQQDERAEYNRTVREVNESMERMKSQAPEELSEVRSELNAIRDSLEHDGNSQRTAGNYSRTAGDHPGTEETVRFSEMQIGIVRARAERLDGAEQKVSDVGISPEESRAEQTASRDREPDNSRNAERDRLLEERSRQRESTSREFSDGAWRVGNKMEQEVGRVGEAEQRKVEQVGNDQQGIGNDQQDIKREQFNTSLKADQIGRGTSYDLGKSASIRKEQHGIIGKYNEIREKIIDFGNRIKEWFTRKPEQTREQTDSPRPTSQNTQPVKENTMPGMSRFAQIQAEQKQAGEKEPEKVAPYQLDETLAKGQNVEVRYNDGRSQVLSAESSREDIQRAKMETSNRQATMQTTHQKPQEPQKESVMDKLNKYSQEAAEGRTEPLQSEQREQTKHIHHRRGHHR